MADALTEKVKQLGLDLGADLIGVAAAQVLNEAITSPHRPEDLLPSAASIVVVALHIPDASLEAQRREISNFSYNMFGYTHLNREMDSIAYRITRFLENAGYESLPIPGRGSHYWESKKYHGPFSFRHAAVAAGLAAFGWSGLALTPQFGPRQRFITVITTAPLEPDAALAGNPCLQCFDCIKSCPAGAITKKPWNCKLGGKTHTYGTVEGDRCWWVAKGLTTRAWPNAPFNPQVDVPRPEPMTAAAKFKALWEDRDARLRCSEHEEGNYGATLCGRCMIFCKAGRRSMHRRLANGCAEAPAE